MRRFIWKVGWIAIALFLAIRTHAAAEFNSVGFSSDLTTTENDWRKEISLYCRENFSAHFQDDIEPRDLYDLHAGGNETQESSRLTRFTLKSCERGAIDWLENQDLFKEIVKKLEKNFRYILHPQVVVEKNQEGEVAFHVAPTGKELMGKPVFRTKLALGLNIKLSRIDDDTLETVTPILKIKTIYQNLEGKIRIDPLSATARVSLELHRYLFNIAKPELHYEVDLKESENHRIRSGFIFKTGRPEIKTGIFGEMNLDDTSRWGVQFRVMGFWNWECYLFKWIRNCANQ
jgi:hypothetical protein